MAGGIETGGKTFKDDATLPARNWYLGATVEKDKTTFKYPTFQPLTYSLNYITHGEAYSLAKAMTETGNIYGFTKSTTDTHLMKDSEWGMIVYLSKSKYGLNEEDIYVNNISFDSGGSSESNPEKNKYATIYAITGCTTGTVDEGGKNVTNREIIIASATNDEATIEGVYKWNQTEGQKASSSGNMYGIYDLSGGLWERTAGYVSNGQETITTYGSSFAKVTEGISSKYVKVYAHNATTDNTEITNSAENTELNAASEENYKEETNKRIYGDAMHETSTAGTSTNSWNNDTSLFVGLVSPFSFRGGNLGNGRSGGLFCFDRNVGASRFHAGFRPALVAL